MQKEKKREAVMTRQPFGTVEPLVPTRRDERLAAMKRLRPAREETFELPDLLRAVGKNDFKAVERIGVKTASVAVSNRAVTELHYALALKHISERQAWKSIESIALKGLGWEHALIVADRHGKRKLVEDVSLSGTLDGRRDYARKLLRGHKKGGEKEGEG